MFVHTGDSVCSPGFYTYSAFIDSTRAFPDFGNAAGDAATNKREIAAFLAQISHETTGLFLHCADAINVLVGDARFTNLTQTCWSNLHTRTIDAQHPMPPTCCVVAGGPLENNQYDWGLCFHEEQSPPSNYCVPDPTWPCAANASYHGRGPIQLSYNYK